MSFINFIIKKLTIVLVGSFLLSGCGVKSAPTQPSKNSDNINYLKEDRKEKNIPAVQGVVGYKKSISDRVYTGGEYQPPKPATETLVKNPLIKGN